MADKRPVFSNLEDATGEGFALAKVLEGDASASKNAAPSLVAKDANGDLVYLQLNNSGSLSVTLDGGNTVCKGGHLTKTSGSQSRTQVGADISLVAGKALSNLEWSLSNFRSTIYEIVIIDDPAGTPVEHAVVDVICGEGDFQDTGKFICMDDIDTTGYTAPVLRLYGTNLNATSDFRGTVKIQEAI